MYWNIIDENRREILKKVVNKIDLKYFYMAGGTALSLQKGYRESFDFDFFVQEKFNINCLISSLKEIGELTVNYTSEGALHCVLNNVKITFLYFPNKLIEELINVEEIDGLYLAGIKDIATMKLLAISQRGTKKDFFDLYHICNRENMSLNDVFSFMKIKYNEEKLNYFHILKSIIYFEDAEDENLPKTFIKYNWEEIKKFYIEEYKKIEI